MRDGSADGHDLHDLQDGVGVGDVLVVGWGGTYGHLYSVVRELREELGIQVFDKEIKYIGEFIFWHRGFPKDKDTVNRENKIDLFWLTNTKEVLEERVQLTNYEKHYHFHLMKCSIDEIDELLQSSSPNFYKRFTDVELSTLLEAFLRYKGEDNYVR